MNKDQEARGEGRMETQMETPVDMARLKASNGKFLIEGIFWETGTLAKREKYPPLYTLNQEPRFDKVQEETLPSAYQIYMTSVDEYDAAIKLVGNMKNWGLLSSANWFLNGDPNRACLYMHEGLAVWRDHMKKRDASLAKKVLHEKALSGDTTAAKAILAETKVKAPVGRANKKAVLSEEDKKKASQMKEWRAKQEANKRAKQ